MNDLREKLRLAKDVRLKLKTLSVASLNEKDIYQLLGYYDEYFGCDWKANILTKEYCQDYFLRISVENDKTLEDSEVLVISDGKNIKLIHATEIKDVS